MASGDGFSQSYKKLVWRWQDDRPVLCIASQSSSFIMASGCVCVCGWVRDASHSSVWLCAASLHVAERTMMRFVCNILCGNNQADNDITG